jgi:hypothetical protein
VSHALARALVAWAIGTAAGCAIIHRTFALDVDERHPRAVVASLWVGGQVAARAVLRGAGDPSPLLAAALAAHPGSTLVYESVVAEGPVPMWRCSDVPLALSVVAGHDGLSARCRGRTEYLTPDDLLAHQAYDKGIAIPSLGLTTGLDVPLALALLSERCGVTVRELSEGALRRFRVVRSTPGAPTPQPVNAETMTDDDVRASAVAAGAFLARGVDDEGRFRYLVDAPTNRTLPGYDWPRHAGATYFLAQVAALSGDADMGSAALRAAGRLRDGATLACGEHRCIGSDSVVDLGSTALAVIAFVEIARTGLDPQYADLVPPLAAFLRSQQRPDGEFMHLYDRGSGRPIDVQLLYYSGEASLALSRAHILLGDAHDLEAASRALSHLVGPAWSFPGSRYYFGEEHWTCQAMDDLWDRSPDRLALDFCLRWQAFNRQLQYASGDTAYDADGAYGFGPILTPRLTPVGSRSEAGIATLHAAQRSGTSPAELRLLEGQTRRALALLVREQFRPGPQHLLADPAAVHGAMPGSEVDWQLRIDYAQHTGSALIRWLARGTPGR